MYAKSQDVPAVLLLEVSFALTALHHAGRDVVENLAKLSRRQEPPSMARALYTDPSKRRTSSGTSPRAESRDGRGSTEVSPTRWCEIGAAHPCTLAVGHVLACDEEGADEEDADRERPVSGSTKAPSN